MDDGTGTEGARTESLKECWEVALFAYSSCSYAKRTPGNQRETLENGCLTVATAVM